MTFEKQNRLESNVWKIGSTEDFLNDIIGNKMTVFCLLTKHGEFLCFSEEDDIYYLSDSTNSDLVVIQSAQKEQETITLYQNISGVFLTPVSVEIEINS